jgi:hypothetical protein
LLVTENTAPHVVLTPSSNQPSQNQQSFTFEKPFCSLLSLQLEHRKQRKNISYTRLQQQQQQHQYY